MQPTRAVCIREVQKSLEQSVKRLLEDKIAKLGVGHLFNITNTHIDTPFGGVLIFNGMQNHTADSIKSLEGFDIAWIEEAQSLSDRSLTLLRPTMRKDGSEIWASWNPHLPSDPIEFLRKDPPPDSIIVKANWRDNPWFPAVLRVEMEFDRSRDINKYAHVWEGEYEKAGEARVLKNWRVAEFESPGNSPFLFGGDWGFARDPNVLVRCFIEGKNLFVDYEAYKVGVEIDETVALFDALACTKQHDHRYPKTTLDGNGNVIKHPFGCDGIARDWIITADSARPETISYLQRHGYPRIEAARKGPNSVLEGLEFLKNYDIVVHPRCVHTIDELTYYSFKRHPLTNEIMPQLEDKKNHVIDALRYAVETVRGVRAGVF